MNKRSHDNRIPLRILGVLVALALLIAACGLSKAEIESRLDALREEPILTTPPPDATVIGQFEREPLSAGSFGGASGGVVMTVWATTASLEELEDWYDTQYEGEYDFASPLLEIVGFVQLTDLRSLRGNGIRVEISSTELDVGQLFDEQTYNQVTHPGMTFVSARVGEG